MFQASWYGSLISIIQSSPEAPIIFTFLSRVFTAESVDSLRCKIAGKISDEDFKVYS